MEVKMIAQRYRAHLPQIFNVAGESFNANGSVPAYLRFRIITIAGRKMIALRTEACEQTDSWAYNGRQIVSALAYTLNDVYTIVGVANRTFGLLSEVVEFIDAQDAGAPVPAPVAEAPAPVETPAAAPVETPEAPGENRIVYRRTAQDLGASVEISGERLIARPPFTEKTPFSAEFTYGNRMWGEGKRKGGRMVWRDLGPIDRDAETRGRIIEILALAPTQWNVSHRESAEALAAGLPQSERARVLALINHYMPPRAELAPDFMI